MMPTDVLLFSLIFPAVAAITGVYLIVRGTGRLSRSGTPVVCGKVECKTPIKSLASGRDCVFSCTVLESYTRGRWRPIFKAEVNNNPVFTIGGVSVGKGPVYLKISDPIITTGTIPHKKDFIENWADVARKSVIYRPVSLVLSIIGRTESSYLPLDGSVLARLQNDPFVKKLLQDSNVGLLRITEHVLADGMEVCAIAEAGKDQQDPIKGTIEFPLILTDMKPEDAMESLKEKALLSMGLGILLLGVSGAILMFLFTQL